MIGGAYRKAVFHQYQKGRDFLVPFAHYLAMQGIVCYTVFYFRVVNKVMFLLAQK